MVFYVIKSVHESDDSLSYVRSYHSLDKAQTELALIISDAADIDKLELYEIDLAAGTNRLIKSALGHLET